MTSTWLSAFLKVWEESPFERFDLTQEQGARLGGTAKSRGVQAFRYFVFGFLALVALVLLLDASVKLGEGRSDLALADARHVLGLLFTAVIVAFSNVSMLRSARGERAVIAWLTRCLE